MNHENNRETSYLQNSLPHESPNGLAQKPEAFERNAIYLLITDLSTNIFRLKDFAANVRNSEGTLGSLLVRPHFIVQLRSYFSQKH